jgi:hypothetical protein
VYSTAVEWQFDVGSTSSRPIVVDEHISRVTVLADSYPDALMTAVLMVSGRRGVEMVTSATYIV